MAALMFAVLLVQQDKRSQPEAKTAPQEKQTQPKEVIFSGPQVGEKLAALPVKLIGAKEPIDLIKKYGEGPLNVVFFHKLTRPGFAFTRLVAKFGAEREKDKLKTAVVFLTDDPPAMQMQLANIQRLLRQQNKNVIVGVSTDGADGPGAYGLNRNILILSLIHI